MQDVVPESVAKVELLVGANRWLLMNAELQNDYVRNQGYIGYMWRPALNSYSQLATGGDYVNFAIYLPKAQVEVYGAQLTSLALPSDLFYSVFHAETQLVDNARAAVTGLFFEESTGTPTPRFTSTGGLHRLRVSSGASATLYPFTLFYRIVG